MAFLFFIFAAVFFVFSPDNAFAAFNIDSILPTTITSADDVLTLSVSASGLDNKAQYFQTAITKEGKTNYFGFTSNNSNDWKKYESSPDDYTSFFTFTPTNGVWSGSVQAKIDTSDSGYVGSGTYTVKLLKYVSSSTGASSNNTATLNINISSALTPSPQSDSKNQTDSPSINLTIPSNLTAGDEFSLPIQIKNFSSAPYYIKIRIGPDTGHLTHGQTKSDADWLSDNDSWAKFPQAKGPDWQGNVSAKLKNNEKEGNYKIVIKFKKVEAESFVESDAKDIHFNSAPPPPPKTSKSSPVPVTIPASNISPTTQIFTASTNLQNEENSTDASIDAKILGLSTSTPSSISSIRSQNKSKTVKMLSGNNNFQVNSTVICLGLFISGFAGVWLVRNHN